MQLPLKLIRNNNLPLGSTERIIYFSSVSLTITLWELFILKNQSIFLRTLSVPLDTLDTCMCVLPKTLHPQVAKMSKKQASLWSCFAKCQRPNEEHTTSKKKKAAFNRRYQVFLIDSDTPSPLCCELRQWRFRTAPAHGDEEPASRTRIPHQSYEPCVRDMRPAERTCIQTCLGL